MCFRPYASRGCCWNGRIHLRLLTSTADVFTHRIDVGAPRVRLFGGQKFLTFPSGLSGYLDQKIFEISIKRIARRFWCTHSYARINDYSGCGFRICQVRGSFAKQHSWQICCPILPTVLRWGSEMRFWYFVSTRFYIKVSGTCDTNLSQNCTCIQKLGSENWKYAFTAKLKGFSCSAKWCARKDKNSVM